ncbi:MAG: phosphotransferase [Calothrix sp. C42_A2020_038]|nr:phosphotransferase [Calothrix sp. C42_A2020_038]
MVFSLSSHNVIQYLQSSGLFSLEDGASFSCQLPQSGKNRNFLVTLPGQKLLVKQERCLIQDGIPQELFNEVLLHKLLEQFPVLRNIPALAPSVVHFDEENSILVRNYLDDYLELSGFYTHDGIYPDTIATTIGSSLAVLHRSTYNHRSYRNFMATAPEGTIRYQFFNPAQGVSFVTPEIFGTLSSSAFEFYVLNQRYESLESAIADLASEWNPCCLTHNDLKLENILVHARWSKLDNCLIRLIDWEAAAWGEPEFDLGTVIADYLRIWLESIVVDSTLELEESLQLALIPIDVIQPSILALIRAYLNAFPMVLEYRQNFIMRVVQFAGLALINHLEQAIKCGESFDNTQLNILFFAKKLLTMPSISIKTVFGVNESSIMEPPKKLSTPNTNEREPNLLRIYYEKPRLRGC